MSRKSTGKRLRFEILKRDGFKCLYCGANAVASVLHIDHVVPVADGGETVPENLVTACADCNGGKADRHLDESSLPQPTSADVMLEHAEQIREYLAAAREVERARQAVVDFARDRWRSLFSDDDMPDALVAGMPTTLSVNGLERVLQAVDATFRKFAHVRYRSDVDMTKYFRGVLRNMRESS